MVAKRVRNFGSNDLRRKEVHSSFNAEAKDGPCFSLKNFSANHLVVTEESTTRSN